MNEVPRAAGDAQPETMRTVSKYLALVLAAAGMLILALLVTSSRHQPLTISFAGFTNVYQFDRPLAKFVTTNRNSRPLHCATILECKTGGGWPVYIGRLPHNDSPRTAIPPGQELAILKLPPTCGVPWRLSVVYDVEETRFGRARGRVADFFHDRNLYKVGQLIYDPKAYIAVGPEIRTEQTP